VDRLVVDAVQLDLIRTHGGLPGLRDGHALESALARPRHRWAYGRTRDLATPAASYGFGLVRHHPHRDGNKRIGFLTMAVFLGLNGYEIKAPEPEVVTVMVSLAAGRMSEVALAKWIRAHIVPCSED
jgi:death-on-curing protein